MFAANKDGLRYQWSFSNFIAENVIYIIFQQQMI